MGLSIISANSSMMKSTKTTMLLGISLILLITEVNSKRVLFIPVPQTSHTRSHTSLAREVVALGHEAWVCIPNVILNKKKVDTTGVNVLQYGENMEDLEHKLLVESGLLDHFWAGGNQNIMMLAKIGDVFWKNSLDILADPKFMSSIQELRPDLIVLDWTPFCRSMLVVPYKLGVPFAFLGSFHDPTNARVPFTPACNPMLMSDYDDKMSFSERISNAFLMLSLLSYNPFCDDHIISRMVPEKPHITVSALSAKAEIFIIETDHILDYSRPMLPNTKFVGGGAGRPAKPLKDPFREFVKKADTGIIIVTFGASILDVPSFISQKMLETFDKLDFKVIWRNNIASPNPSRIMTSQWIPQNDLLGSNQTRVFVSHCGTNGLYETLYHGVPVVCLPIYADQFHNSQRVVNKGYGLRADIRTITSEEFAELILQVANNETFRTNIKTASTIFRHLFKHPVKDAALWLDHVMQFGGAYMRYAGQEMPLYQYLLLDVLLVVLIVFSMVMISCCACFRCICRCCCRRLCPKPKED